MISCICDGFFCRLFLNWWHSSNRHQTYTNLRALIKLYEHGMHSNRSLISDFHFLYMTVIICFVCGLSVERYENGHDRTIVEIIRGEPFETIGRILEREADEHVIVCASLLRIYTSHHLNSKERNLWTYRTHCGRKENERNSCRKDSHRVCIRPSSDIHNLHPDSWVFI